MLLHFESSPGSTKWTSISLSSTKRFWVRTSISALAYPSKVWGKKPRRSSPPLCLFTWQTGKNNFNLINEDFLKIVMLEYARTQGSSFHFSDMFTRPAACFCSSFFFWSSKSDNLGCTNQQFYCQPSSLSICGMLDIPWHTQYNWADVPTAWNRKNSRSQFELPLLSNWYHKASNG